MISHIMDGRAVCIYNDLEEISGRDIWWNDFLERRPFPISWMAGRGVSIISPSLVGNHPQMLQTGPDC